MNFAEELNSAVNLYLATIREYSGIERVDAGSGVVALPRFAESGYAGAVSNDQGLTAIHALRDVSQESLDRCMAAIRRAEKSMLRLGAEDSTAASVKEWVDTGKGIADTIWDIVDRLRGGGSSGSEGAGSAGTTQTPVVVQQTGGNEQLLMVIGGVAVVGLLFFAAMKK